jgi:hypothetical protein
MLKQDVTGLPFVPLLPVRRRTFCFKFQIFTESNKGNEALKQEFHPVNPVKNALSSVLAFSI